MYKSIVYYFLAVSIFNFRIALNREDRIINETERRVISSDDDDDDGDENDFKTVKIVKKEDKIINENQRAPKEDIYADRRVLDDARGFGNDLKWIKFDAALKLNRQHGIPVFVLIHKSWCGACQNLKSKLANSIKFKELSEHFLMVNLEDENEPLDRVYAPDGSYIPRILFIDPAGRVRHDVFNREGNPQYKYFYSNEIHLINSMENALALFYEEFTYDEETEEWLFNAGQYASHTTQNQNDGYHQDL